MERIEQFADFSQIYICNKEVLTLGEQVDKIWENIVSKRGSGFFGFPSKFEALNNKDRIESLIGFVNEFNKEYPKFLISLPKV